MVNSLIASLFVYKMMVLPLMPKDIVKNLENVIREFIWDGKKAKIAYAVLQNDKNSGGLGLVNFRSKEVALKSSWPYILSTKLEYSDIVYTQIRCQELKSDIWRCNLHQDDIRTMKITNSFWRDVLLCWSEVNSFYGKKVENQIIWYNSQIRVGGKPIFWRDSYRAGLKFVYQLFEEGNFKSYEQLQNEFGLSQMRINSIKSALPKDWVTFFVENPVCTFFPLPPHNYDMVINVYGKGYTRKVYKLTLDDVMLIHNKYIKLRDELGNYISESLYDYGLDHVLIYKVTNIVKYRSFQYRLLQRAIVTNIHLYKWGMKESELCSFCGEERETYTHLFCDCLKIVEVWSKVWEYARTRFNVTEIRCDPVAIIGNRVGNFRSSIVNLLVLITEQFIYAQRCAGCVPSFSALLMIFKQIESIEKYIASKHGKLLVHTRKWAAVNQLNEMGGEGSLEDFICMYNQ